MRCLNNLNSFDNNQNIAWDKGAFLLITETRFCGIASNDEIKLSNWSNILI